MPRAAVCTELGAPLEILELELAPPRAGELRVKLGASGICASDIAVQRGALPSPLPIVLGHEGAGVVAEVGEGVESVAVGDHVVVSAQPQCGACRRCARGQANLCELGADVLASGALLDGTPRFVNGGGPVHQMVASGTYAEEVVVSEISVVRIPDDVPFVPASLIGCGVLTGAGAALNTASIREGDTVAVLGCGSVGLAALQGARLAGAGTIVACDLLPAKLELARELGATHVVNPGEQDPIAAIKELTGGWRADVVIEAIGAQATVDQAIRMAAKGGEVVLVGAGGPDTRIDIPQFTGLVGPGKTLKGCLFGSADNRRDVPRLVEAYRRGELQLDRLVSRTFTLDRINEGFAALGAGDVISAVVELEA